MVKVFCGIIFIGFMVQVFCGIICVGFMVQVVSGGSSFIFEIVLRK